MNHLCFSTFFFVVAHIFLMCVTCCTHISGSSLPKSLLHTSSPTEQTAVEKLTGWWWFAARPQFTTTKAAEFNFTTFSHRCFNATPPTFFCESIRFSEWLLSSHRNHHEVQSVAKPLFGTVISIVLEAGLEINSSVWKRDKTWQNYDRFWDKTLKKEKLWVQYWVHYCTHSKWCWQRGFESNLSRVWNLYVSTFDFNSYI